MSQLVNRLRVFADANIPGNGVCTAAANRIAELEAENERLRVDAARWNAFINCGRISLQGHAGINTKPGDPSHNDYGYAHFGAEFWTNKIEDKYYDADKKAYAIMVLTEFADAAIKTAALESNNK